MLLNKRNVTWNLHSIVANLHLSQDVAKIKEIEGRHGWLRCGQISFQAAKLSRYGSLININPSGSRKPIFQLSHMGESINRGLKGAAVEKGLSKGLSHLKQSFSQSISNLFLPISLQEKETLKDRQQTRQESSMIHSASPQSRPAVIVAWFWSFGTYVSTDTLCENSDHYRSASWINKSEMCWFFLLLLFTSLKCQFWSIFKLPFFLSVSSFP